MEWPLDYVQCSFDDLARMCSDFGKLFSVSLFRWCEGKYFVLRVIIQKAIHWNQITNKIHHIVIVGTVLNRIEKSYRDRGKIDSPNTHYVNGVLCKMLLRVAVYCYFFFLCSTWQMQFTQQTKQVRIFTMLHNFIQ